MKKTIAIPRQTLLKTPMEIIAEVKTDKVKRAGDWWYHPGQQSVPMQAILTYCSETQRYYVFTRRWSLRFKHGTKVGGSGRWVRAGVLAWQHRENAGKVKFYTDYYKKALKSKQGWSIITAMPKKILTDIQVGQLDKALAKGD